MDYNKINNTSCNYISDQQQTYLMNLNLINRDKKMYLYIIIIKVVNFLREPRPGKKLSY